MNDVIKSERKEHGQSMVELALTITILMAMLAGTIDLGRAFFTWTALRDAAQEGASYGSFAPPPAEVYCSNLSTPPYPEICKRVWDNLEQVVNSPTNQITINVTYPDGSCTQGHTIQVDVREPAFPLTMPFLGTILGSQTIMIHATINDTIITSKCP